MQSLIELSDNDKDLVFQSLLIITTNLDLFVIKFYFYFLQEFWICKMSRSCKLRQDKIPKLNYHNY